MIYKENNSISLEIRSSGSSIPPSQLRKSCSQYLSGVQLLCIPLRSIVVRNNRNNCVVAYVPCHSVSSMKDLLTSGVPTVNPFDHSGALIPQKRYRPKWPDQSPKDPQRRCFFDQEARSAVDPIPALLVWLP